MTFSCTGCVQVPAGYPFLLDPIYMALNTAVLRTRMYPEDAQPTTCPLLLWTNNFQQHVWGQEGSGQLDTTSRRTISLQHFKGWRTYSDSNTGTTTDVFEYERTSLTDRWAFPTHVMRGCYYATATSTTCVRRSIGPFHEIAVSVTRAAAPPEPCASQAPWSACAPEQLTCTTGSTPNPCE